MQRQCAGAATHSIAAMSSAGQVIATTAFEQAYIDATVGYEGCNAYLVLLPTAAAASCQHFASDSRHVSSWSHDLLNAGN